MYVHKQTKCYLIFFHHLTSKAKGNVNQYKIQTYRKAILDVNKLSKKEKIKITRHNATGYIFFFFQLDILPTSIEISNKSLSFEQGISKSTVLVHSWTKLISS